MEHGSRSKKAFFTQNGGFGACSWTELAFMAAICTTNSVTKPRHKCQVLSWTCSKQAIRGHFRTCQMHCTDAFSLNSNSNRHGVCDRQHSYNQYSVQFLGIAEIGPKSPVLRKMHSLNWPNFEGWQPQSENCTDY